MRRDLHARCIFLCISSDIKSRQITTHTQKERTDGFFTRLIAAYYIDQCVETGNRNTWNSAE